MTHLRNRGLPNRTQRIETGFAELGDKSLRVANKSDSVRGAVNVGEQAGEQAHTGAVQPINSLKVHEVDGVTRCRFVGAPE